MMRQPTPPSVAFAWWKSAIAGENPPRHEGEPQPGWYRTKLIKGGPHVAARIWIEREIDFATGELAEPEEYALEVDGERRDPYRFWTYLTPISRDEYNRLLFRRNLLPSMQASMARVDLVAEPMLPE